LILSHANLEVVAAELQAQPAVGSGNSHRIAHEVARRLFGRAGGALG